MNEEQKRRNRSEAVAMMSDRAVNSFFGIVSAIGVMGGAYYSFRFAWVVVEPSETLTSYLVFALLWALLGILFFLVWGSAVSIIVNIVRLLAAIVIAGWTFVFGQLDNKPEA